MGVIPYTLATAGSSTDTDEDDDEDDDETAMSSHTPATSTHMADDSATALFISNEQGTVCVLYNNMFLVPCLGQFLAE